MNKLILHPYLTYTYDLTGNKVSETWYDDTNPADGTRHHTYADGFRYGGRTVDGITTDTLEQVEFPGGYFDSRGIPHYRIHDYFGNVAMIVNNSGTIEQHNGYLRFDDPTTNNDSSIAYANYYFNIQGSGLNANNCQYDITKISNAKFIFSGYIRDYYFSNEDNPININEVDSIVLPCLDKNTWVVDTNLTITFKNGIGIDSYTTFSGEIFKRVNHIGNQ